METRLPWSFSRNNSTIITGIRLNIYGDQIRLDIYGDSWPFSRKSGSFSWEIRLDIYRDQTSMTVFTKKKIVFFSWEIPLDIFWDSIHDRFHERLDYIRLDIFGYPRTIVFMTNFLPIKAQTHELIISTWNRAVVASIFTKFSWEISL